MYSVINSHPVTFISFVLFLEKEFRFSTPICLFLPLDPHQTSTSYIKPSFISWFMHIRTERYSSVLLSNLFPSLRACPGHLEVWGRFTGDDCRSVVSVEFKSVTVTALLIWHAKSASYSLTTCRSLRLCGYSVRRIH